MTKHCPGCGAHVPLTETNHDYRCLEQRLVALYNMGVQRGVAGEAPDAGFDGRAAGVIGMILETAMGWQVAARDAAPLGVRLSARRDRGADLDALVARILDWRDVGWLHGRPVSGEPAWHDPRVVRRRWSEHEADALPLLELPLLKPYDLIRIHRLVSHTWEWHFTRSDRSGTMESLVVAPTAPLAICRALIRMSGHGARESAVG